MTNETRTKMQQVELVWRYFYQNCTVLPLYLMEADFRAILLPHFQNMVLQIRTMVAGERVKEIRYPMDWWQAFRERWFPRFWLKWYPVRYHEWNVDLLYPQIQRRAGARPVVAVYSNSDPASPGFLPRREEL